MSCRLWLVLASLALPLAACSSSDRPLGAICQGICPKPDGPVTLMRNPVDQAEAETPPSISDVMASDQLKDQLRTLMRKKVDSLPAGIPERALADLPLAEDGRLRLLALSSGGPFGAFGAGFLNGWSEQTDRDRARPEAFDVVTGVSAGALLATHAFLGREGDAVLERQYTTISTADVFRQRSPFSALFSNALFDTAPLRRTLQGLVTPDLLDQVAEATAPDPATGDPGRFLLVLAVDLDSGLPRIIDLGAIAREQNAADRIGRYTNALMASSAIPVAFPPVFIDGAMHVDGGARLALFFNRFMEDQRAAIDGLTIPAPALDIIVNAEATVEPACTDNTLLGIGRRSVDVVLNQQTLDGLYRTISEAEQDGIDVRYVTADSSGCARPDDPADPFQRAFLQCLFAFGKEVGSSAAPWKTGLQDFPKLQIESGQACLMG
ncbi:MAG: patatin-like phospholipase family protein [Alphaproteobacteria bacterium]|nr:patatin-like phospholipase family protein [Alphaproteobacteria bacterium]